MNNLTCKLTSPELRKRKQTVIENLRKQIIEKKELSTAILINSQARMKKWMNLQTL